MLRNGDLSKQKIEFAFYRFVYGMCIVKACIYLHTAQNKLNV